MDDLTRKALEDIKAAGLAALAANDTITQQLQALLYRLQGLLEPQDVKPFALPPKSKGIDVSKWQGVINWNKVKAAGIAFAYIKASEGTTGIDPFFTQNWDNAKAAGLPRGATHYFHFAYDPIVQADFFLARLGHDLGELPPAVDVEDETTPPNMAALKSYCEHLSTALNQKPVIYTGAWWWKTTRIPPQPWAKDYPLWTAWYPPATAPQWPGDWPAWAIWQTSSKGRVDGINADVDLDVSA